jgi:hypothetical protein
LGVGFDSNGQRRETISGGSGVLLGVAWLWTPLWAADEVGFGLGAELGLKYDEASGNGYKVSLRRFPAAITAHTFVHMTDRWWMVLRGGVEKELGLRLSVSGGDYPVGSTPMTGTLGGLGEGGLYYITYLGAQRTAIMLAFRYTSASDRRSWGSLNAHSFGLVFTIHYNL